MLSWMTRCGRMPRLSQRVCVAVSALVCSTVAMATIGDGQITTFGQYQTEIIHQADGPLFLITTAALGGSEAQHELIAVAGDGTVLRLSRTHTGWSVQPLPVSMEPVVNLSMASRPTISAGDVLPQHAGDEIVAQTADNVSVLVQTEPGTWEKQLAADFSDLVGLHWGARIGDIDPARPGSEIFYIFEGIFDISTGHVAQSDGERWHDQMVYLDEVGMDSAIGDVDPANPGNEIVITTEMGPTYLITPQPGTPGLWPKRTLWDDFDNSGWRVLIANVLPEREGNEIVYGTRYNNSILLSYETEDDHEMEVLFTGSAVEPEPSMYDIAIGNINPDSSSLEIVGVDATGRVYLVEHDGDSWSGRTLWQDPSGGLYAVTVADFVPHCSGDEIIVTGASGAVTLLAPPNAGPADLDCNNAVNVFDLLALLADWGECDSAGRCTADLDGNGIVNVFDLLMLLGEWG